MSLFVLFIAYSNYIIPQLNRTHYAMVPGYEKFFLQPIFPTLSSGQSFINIGFSCCRALGWLELDYTNSQLLWVGCTKNKLSKSLPNHNPTCIWFACAPNFWSGINFFCKIQNSFNVPTKFVMFERMGLNRF